MIAMLMWLACPGPDTGETGPEPEPEVLTPEPAGAPVDVADGRLSCVGDNAPDPASAGAVELTGYVRTLADPVAANAPPAAQVDVFDADGVALGTAFADPSRDGRVEVTVPIPADGFTGWAVVSHADYLPWRFRSSRPVTSSHVDGWTWLVTPAERDALAADLGVAPGAGDGVLVGVVHDCDGFGVANAVVVVNGATDGLVYAEGFAPTSSRTYTATSGRFVLPVVPAGPVTVKAFGRLEAGGPLVLLSSAEVEVQAGGVSAAGLEPRVSYW